MKWNRWDIIEEHFWDTITFLREKKQFPNYIRSSFSKLFFLKKFKNIQKLLLNVTQFVKFTPYHGNDLKLSIFIDSSTDIQDYLQKYCAFFTFKKFSPSPNQISQEVTINPLINHKITNIQ